MLVDTIVDTAKLILTQEGNLQPAVFFAKDEKLLAPPMPMDLSDYEAKLKTYFIAGVASKVVGADFVIMVTDAALRTINKNQDPNFKYDQTEAPLTYPKSMRTECIVVSIVDCKSKKDRVIIVPYKGGDGEPVEFLPDDQFKDSEMECESLMSEYIHKGRGEECSSTTS